MEQCKEISNGLYELEACGVQLMLLGLAPHFLLNTTSLAMEHGPMVNL